MPQTAFFWDERCFWHSGGNYALTARVGGLVQPLAAGGLPESPETKRRLKNLLDVTGLAKELACQSAEPASRQDLLRVHSASYLDEFKRLSDIGGGELGERTPFGKGGYEISALSAGLVKAALASVLEGKYQNAYALSRPPGHHCLPDWPNGFCLMNNIGIAIKSALANQLAHKIAVVDWDVHHGNGTQAIFWDDPNVLFVSSQLAGHWPFSGDIHETGGPLAPGLTINLPFPEGATGDVFLRAYDTVLGPAIDQFKPTWVLVSAGFDSHRDDPLGGLGLSAADYALMAQRLASICPARTILFLEGGYNLKSTALSVGATAAALVGAVANGDERATKGGPGGDVVEAAALANRQARNNL